MKNKKNKEGDVTFSPELYKMILTIIDDKMKEISVSRADFEDSKRVVKGLAEAQARTEAKVAELAEAQARTEAKVAELAEAQKKTELSIKELTEGLKYTRRELGGLSKSFSYAFENEVYRNLPKVLKEKYGIETKERFVRVEIGGKEINLFGKGLRNGGEIFIVGEVKLRLDENKIKRRLREVAEEEEEDVFEELDDKVKAVKSEYGDIEIFKILVANFADRIFLEEARKEGVPVVQSFEW